MHVPVGPYRYQLQLTEQPICGPGGLPATSAVDTNRQIIRISSGLSPAKRFAAFIHRWTEAIRADCDTGLVDALPAEAICKLMGVGMAQLSPKDFARIHVYLTQGIRPRNVMMLADIDQPIPFVHVDA